MKKILTFIKAAAKWVSIDGLLHFLVSALGVLVLGSFLPLWVAVLIMAAIGLAKEFIWDLWLKRGAFERKDLICDAAGIVFGVVAVLIYLYLR